MKDKDLLIKQAEARTEKAELRAEQAEIRERAMSASELSYRRLFEAARDGILILNVDTGRIDDVNPFLVELLGFSHAEMVGKTVGELCPFKDILSNQAMLERLQKDGYLRYENLPLQTKDGRHVEVEFVSNVYQAGDVKVIQCNIRDLTDRKLAEVALRDSEEKFRSMFTAAATGIAISTPHGRFLEVNAAYCQMLGYTEEELLARDFASLTHPDDLALNLKLRDEILDGKRKSFVMEKRYLKKNGDMVWTRHSVSAVRAAGGKIERLIVIAENITERKLAEESLRLLNSAMLQAKESVLITNAELDQPGPKIIFVNPAFTTLTGYAAEEVIGKTPRILQGPRTDKTILKRLRENLGRGEAFEGQSVNYRKDGTAFDMEWQVAPIHDGGGKITHFLSIQRDITERKQAQETLLKQQTELRVLFDLMPAMLCFKDTKNVYLRVNQRLAEAAGRPVAEIEGKPAAEIFPRDAARYFADDLEVIQSRRAKLNILERLQSPDGTDLWVQTDKVPVCDQDGKVTGIVVMRQDITERKWAEEALVLFRTLIDQSNDSIEVVEPATYRYLDVNESACTTHGYTREEMLSMMVGDIDPDFNPAMREQVERVLQTMGWMMFESRHRRKDGTTFPVEVTLKLVHLDKDYTVGIVRDITERKRIEARFRRLVNSNVQGVFFWNTKGEVTDGNDAFLKVAGCLREDLEAGRINWAAMTPPEYADLDQRAQKQIAATGICVPYEKEWIRKDGRRVPILLGAAIFEDNPDEGVCFVLDLTEQKKLEEKFRRAQKMDSFGQLAGGVAHDFNNILAVIQIQTDMFKAAGQASPEQSEFVEMIGSATQRAITLTRQLLLFSRKEAMQPRDLDLNKAINEMTNMLRRILGEDIEMIFKFSLQPLFIHGDAGMMDQVLMNLAVNSRDAMPRGGRLVIETSPVDFDESVVAPSAQARPGAFVCLSVSDTGCGIPPENLSRIFEPFFTTKDVGKGTGLGLATVFGIVQQHRGWINVYSEVGQGTTFRIYLPRLAAASLQKPEQPVVTSLPGGKETILLVEDDDFLRPSVRQTLSKLGYRVLEAGNGIKALEVWKQHRDEIHLVLTDLVMPGGMNGKDLGERLLQENPKLKVIYASGYSADIVSQDFPLKEGVNFLTKPFQTQKLAETIRNRLNRD